MCQDQVSVRDECMRKFPGLSFKEGLCGRQAGPLAPRTVPGPEGQMGDTWGQAEEHSRVGRSRYL